MQQKADHVKRTYGQSVHKSWAGQYADHWWILAYYKEGLWNACFFNWDSHHEHVSGSSFEDARTRAERRIDSIENEALASVKPPPPAMWTAFRLWLLDRSETTNE
jgi:hypothetical protein